MYKEEVGMGPPVLVRFRLAHGRNGVGGRGCSVRSAHVVVHNRRVSLPRVRAVQLRQRDAAGDLALNERGGFLVLGRRVLLENRAMVLARVATALENQLYERLELAQRVTRVVDVAKRLQVCQDLS